MWANTITMRLLLFPIFILLATASYAQDYVITVQKDTLFGEVEILLPDQFNEELSITVNGDKKRFKSFQVLEASADSTIYHPAKIQNKYRIVELVEGGYLSLYLYRADESYDFNTKYLLKSTTQGLIVPNIFFRKQVTDFLDDCPEVVAKLDDKTYKKNNLVQIVKDYNACLEMQTQNKFSDNVPEADKSKFELVSAIQQKLDTSKDSELNTLLNDIKQKVKTGETIPGYLISALKEQTQSMDTIKTEVDQLLEALNK